MSFSALFRENSSPQDGDLATQSNYHDIRTTHIDLTWAIDWDEQLIGGTAILTLEATSDVSGVILDTSHLDISKVEIGGKRVKWELGEKAAEIIGRGLTVELPEPVKDGDKVDMKISYSTTKKCTAVGWLTPLYVPFHRHELRAKADEEREVPVPLLSEPGGTLPLRCEGNDANGSGPCEIVIAVSGYAGDQGDLFLEGQVDFAGVDVGIEKVAGKRGST